MRNQQPQGLWRHVLLGAVLLASSASLVAEEQPSPAQQEMNELGEQALASGLQLINHSGGMYPYAMVQSGEQTQLLGYQGDPEARPPEQEWSALLLQRLRSLAETDDTITAMALIRLHEVPTRSGDGSVRGLWVLLDQRELRPTLLFLPFLPGEDGQHRVGELIYYGSEQRIFPDS